MNMTEELAGAIDKSFAWDFEKKALERFKSLGLPDKKNEKWKYTNIEKVIPQYDLNKQASFPYALKTETGEDKETRVVFVNGELNQELSDLRPQSLDSKNEGLFSALKDKFTGLLENDALFQLVETQSANQYFLELEGVADRPIRVHHIYSGQRAKHSSAHLHVLAKKSAQASIMETHEQLNEAENFINNASSFYLEENSRLLYIKAQTLNDQSSFVQNTRALAMANSRFESFTIDLGAKIARNNIWIRLEAEGASCLAHGLYALAGEQHCDTNSFIHHAKPHTESSQLYKGIMRDKSHGVFTGLIRVEKDAQQISSDQLNKNLLLHKGARAHSRPQLEIYADDVKCAHGSTTGQLSEEELFYFESRGIPKERARELLAQAFMEDVVLKISDPLLRNSARSFIEKSAKEKSAMEKPC